ncbi:hypothetical protein [Plantactinospora sp. KBS50]|uniref:hypothetical protein n=1 Tax=Plantactinospora sp. KBS50 TaxID=2024580 RepID=UPI0012FE165B|nr:hypothetical protein [Plantactinospora sp. KBS50]
MSRAWVPGTGWRRRWARAENRRRLRAYQAAMAQWCRRDADLRRLRAAAEADPAPAGADSGAGTGTGDGARGLPIRLDPDEAVLAVAPAVRLVSVRARHAPGTPGPVRLPVPRADGVLTGRPPYGLRTIDGGLAVLTDRRVLLAGRIGEREWPYRDLAGLGHHPSAPLTLLYKRGRRTVSGLLLPPAAAGRFRYALDLAYVAANGRRPALLARLDGMIEEHAAARPERPATASAAAAPRWALVPDGALAVGGSLAVTALAVAAVLLHPSGPDGDRLAVPVLRPSAPAPVVPQPEIPAPTGSSAPPEPTSGTGVPVRPAVEPLARVRSTPAPASPPASTRPPTPAAPSTPAGPGSAGPATPTPTGTPAPLCGAPANPYGYTYCPGGTYVTSPDPGVCTYFGCVDDFWTAAGYLVLCEDGAISLAGGTSTACAAHGGVRQPVYAAAPPAVG